MNTTARARVIVLKDTVAVGLDIGYTIVITTLHPSTKNLLKDRPELLNALTPTHRADIITMYEKMRGIQWLENTMWDSMANVIDVAVSDAA